MKLFATLVAGALATTRQPCPNDKWFFDMEKGCNPVGVKVQCNPTTMSVEFLPEHIFAHGHTATIQGSDSRAKLVNAGNDPECQLAWDSVTGTYKAEWDLDKCGGEVTQEDDGFIRVSNKIQGVSYQSAKFNLFTTSTLSFNAVCGYRDTYTPRTVIEIIETNYEGDVENYGEFGFEMIPYCDREFQKAITSSTVLGEKIYVGIRPKMHLPKIVDYFVTDCKASDTESTNFVDLIDNQCFLNNPLTVESPFNPTVGGVSVWAGEEATYAYTQHFRGLQYSFDAFSFAENGSQMDISCDVKVCAVDSAGKKINPNCANSGACSDCAADYSRPTAFCSTTETKTETTTTVTTYTKQKVEITQSVSDGTTTSVSFGEECFKNYGTDSQEQVDMAFCE